MFTNAFRPVIEMFFNSKFPPRGWPKIFSPDIPSTLNFHILEHFYYRSKGIGEHRLILSKFSHQFGYFSFSFFFLQHIYRIHLCVCVYMCICVCVHAKKSTWVRYQSRVIDNIRRQDWLVVFYGISTFIGYLMLNPFLYKRSVLYGANISPCKTPETMPKNSVTIGQVNHCLHVFVKDHYSSNSIVVFASDFLCVWNPIYKQ